MQIQETIDSLKSRVFKISNQDEFEQIALEIYRFQYDNVVIYNQYAKILGKSPDTVKSIYDIPFLPIEFYKKYKIHVKGIPVEKEFLSSGTTGARSTHYVCDMGLYQDSYEKCFESFFGSQSQYLILGLLPSYLENQGSSLVWMVDQMIKKSKYKESGFFLNNYAELAELLKYHAVVGTEIILIGVTYALLELADKYPVFMPHTRIFETGGMKGRRKELVREEVHDILREKFGVSRVYSEYGMTELLSQAWSKDKGKYFCPPWMKTLIREPTDPFTLCDDDRTGGVNIIDLANLCSCAFIETKDLGKNHLDGSFEIMGRFDQSDIRGCNLLSI